MCILVTKQHPSATTQEDSHDCLICSPNIVWHQLQPLLLHHERADGCVGPRQGQVVRGQDEPHKRLKPSRHTAAAAIVSGECLVVALVLAVFEAGRGLKHWVAVVPGRTAWGAGQQQVGMQVLAGVSCVV